MEKDYEKLYKEASERARKMIFNNPETSEIIKEVFPEILGEEETETEDERIKRLLIKGFKNYGSGDAIFSGVKCKNIISWLEKQSTSQRPLFNMGDTIIHKELGEIIYMNPIKLYE